MQKSVFSPQQEALQNLLRQVRRKAGLRQVDLALRLDRPQAFVSRYEKGEKMLDVAELRQICHAIGLSLPEFVALYEERLASLNL